MNLILLSVEPKGFTREPLEPWKSWEEGVTPPPTIRVNVSFHLKKGFHYKKRKKASWTGAGLEYLQVS